MPTNNEAPTLKREFPPQRIWLHKSASYLDSPPLYSKEEDGWWYDRANLARPSVEAQIEKLNEYFAYWLLRAYQSGHREGWEEGPSTQQTMNDLLHVLANLGYEPAGAKAAELLKKRMAYFL